MNYATLFLTLTTDNETEVRARLAPILTELGIKDAFSEDRADRTSASGATSFLCTYNGGKAGEPCYDVLVDSEDIEDQNKVFDFMEAHEEWFTCNLVTTPDGGDIAVEGRDIRRAVRAVQAYTQLLLDTGLFTEERVREIFL